MKDLSYSSFVKHHKFLYRIIHVFLLILCVFMYYMKEWKLEERGWYTLFFVLVIIMWGLKELLGLLNYFDSRMFQFIFEYIELFLLGIFMSLLPLKSFVFSVCSVIYVLISVTYITIYTDVDRDVILFRKIAVLFNLVVSYFIAMFTNTNDMYVGYLLTYTIVYTVIIYLVTWLVGQYHYFNEREHALFAQNSSLEKRNTDLMKYRDRVKEINEQINFQKIDLKRANENLKQLSDEAQSRAEVMKYIASSYDVSKCLDVIASATLEVKKAKLCAMYIEKNVYMNSEPTVIVKTDYTSMDHRLKKEIRKIYEDFCETKEDLIVYRGDDVKNFKFIMDANVQSVAIFSMSEKKKKNGIMIVCSQYDDFFDSGMDYFAQNIAQYNIAVKSSVLYLKTQEMARKDGLTGIYNRIYFNELFDNTAKKIKKNKQCMTVALFDIDKFKLVNDTYGHLAGDEVIKMVARVGNEFAEKNGGFACRYGGEEFVIAFPKLDEKEASVILEQMHEAIKNEVVKSNDNLIKVNVSIGYSCYPTICPDTDVLVSRADKAMYYSKEHGRGRLVLDFIGIEKEE